MECSEVRDRGKEDHVRVFTHTCLGSKSSELQYHSFCLNMNRSVNVKVKICLRLFTQLYFLINVYILKARLVTKVLHTTRAVR